METPPPFQAALFRSTRGAIGDFTGNTDFFSCAAWDLVDLKRVSVLPAEKRGATDRMYRQH